MSPLYYGSNGDGWFSVFVIVPVIGLVIWGLNTFWLHRLKKGDMDYSPEGFRKRARIFAIDRKSTRLNSSHKTESRMPSSA